MQRGRRGGQRPVLDVVAADPDVCAVGDHAVLTVAAGHGLLVAIEGLDDVVSRTAVDHVDAVAREDPVVAGAPRERVAAGVPDQHVVARAAGHVLGVDVVVFAEGAVGRLPVEHHADACAE